MKKLLKMGIRYMSDRGTTFCRGCAIELDEEVIYLGEQPLSNMLPKANSKITDNLYPLRFKICLHCGLGQIGEFVSPKEIFQDYTYFSSTSKSWLAHAKSFASNAIQKLNLQENDLVVEIASNDGYLLQYFKQEKCRVLGIEPAANVANFANERDIPTEVAFFSKSYAESLLQRGLIPKLVVCNNVVAHVPDLNDFLAGLSLLANAGARISIEAPSMLTMLRDNLFDTIYHEHFSYLSVTSINHLANLQELRLVEVEELPTHGGSYRYWLGSLREKPEISVEKTLTIEKTNGILNPELHESFKRNSLRAIREFKKWCEVEGKETIGYGAAAKATVLLNASGASNQDFICVIDNAPSKQDRLIPGANIPILSPNAGFLPTVERVMIFPWNISKEIAEEISVKFPNFRGEVWVPLPSLKRIHPV